MKIIYLPRIMCICLTRFLKKGRFYDYTKDNTYVDFPFENLNMDNYIWAQIKNIQNMIYLQ